MGMKLIRLRSKLDELHQAENINVVVYERPAGRHANSIIHQSKLIAIIEEWCEINNIEYRAYSAPEIKKFATGKGNAGKPMMIQSAQEKYNCADLTDNEADALHLLHLAKEEYYN
jgi:Holliday junction resolvasome RuvABC endonuclease subunit